MYNIFKLHKSTFANYNFIHIQKFKTMKTLQKIALFIALVALFASCQSQTDVPKILADQDTKKAIMESIANDSDLSREMMETMMKSENSKMIMKGNDKMTMMMMEDHGTMMKMMKDNPDMMKSMMSGMMESCKNDTAMMSSMCKSMMEDPQMMEMMHKNMGGKMDMKGMKKMEGMDHKMK